MTISVNVSWCSFVSRTLLSKFVDFEKNDVPPDLIELELTESVMMDNPQVVIAALQELKSLGCSIAIDDLVQVFLNEVSSRSSGGQIKSG